MEWITNIGFYIFQCRMLGKRKKCFYIWGWDWSKHSVKCAEPVLHLPQITDLILETLVVRKLCSLSQIPGASLSFLIVCFQVVFSHPSSRLLFLSEYSLHLFLNALNEEEIQQFFVCCVFWELFLHDIIAFLSQDTFFNKWDGQCSLAECSICLNP